MKFKRKPIFTGNIPGPWGVDSTDVHWYIVNSETMQAKRIGYIRAKRANYFDAAIREADKRNGELNAN